MNLSQATIALCLVSSAFLGACSKSQRPLSSVMAKKAQRSALIAHAIPQAETMPVQAESTVAADASTDAVRECENTAGVSQLDLDNKFAVALNREDLFEMKCLALAGANVNQTQKYEEGTALHIIAANLQETAPAEFDFYLSKGIDLNAQDATKRTALFWAVNFDNLIAARALLAKPEIKQSLLLTDEYGKTPYDWARELQMEEMQELLREAAGKWIIGE